ncbi:hypothetical protein DY000_02015316 [Brassica cretica]|uniref:Reverse transcriptase zinc-binding domain-containing protein n=1 Tax=Brassica cretica TaxID=69181 RepID=A0ABQ7D586_BRACR|nr:hypothetical protein DY000_02015316 [Brassica cretica]
MYTLVRQQKDKIPWTKLVWFSQGVLRFDFITWLVFQDRLATGHRTCRWGQTVVGTLFGVEPDPDWEITSTQVLSGSYDRLTFILLRRVLQLTIYFIWRERNARKHDKGRKTGGPAGSDD